MWGVFLAVVLVGSIVATGATMPARRARVLAGKLAELERLLGRGDLTLDQAEDGVVLARRHGRADLEQKFRQQVSVLKDRREAARRKHP